ncbi:MAG: DNA methyltransferase [Ignavibacteria bacterium]|nr:DNA methyltransferase [Ignavibacteria bacterium]
MKKTENKSNPLIEEEELLNKFVSDSDNKDTPKPRTHGFIFACTNKSESELISNSLIVTGKPYANKVFAVKEGDFIFLYNLDTDTLFGTFRAVGEPFFDKSIRIFNGKYPYGIKFEKPDEIKKISKASLLFKKINISWKDILTEKGALVIKSHIENRPLFIPTNNNLIDELYRPQISSTTLWDFPIQSYGDVAKGNNKYPGVTPAFIIYNLIWRYTEPGDLVCDPMAGSGTTIDVCKEERRRVVAFDIVPTREDIIQADARNLPLQDNSVDMVFIDSPYGDNIKYNNHPENIGNLPATSDKFFEELEKVMVECKRILKEEKILAWLIGDQWAKGIFVPVGFKVYDLLTKYFVPVDVVCVVRRNQSSNTPFWHSKAIQHNFFLRGYKHLIIVKKSSKAYINPHKKKIEWNFYER